LGCSTDDDDAHNAAVQTEFVFYWVVCYRNRDGNKIFTNIPPPVRFQILKAANIKVTTFGDIATCSLVEVDPRFRGAHCLYHQIIYFSETTRWNIPEGCYPYSPLPVTIWNRVNNEPWSDGRSLNPSPFIPRSPFLLLLFSFSSVFTPFSQALCCHTPELSITQATYFLIYEFLVAIFFWPLYYHFGQQSSRVLSLFPHDRSSVVCVLLRNMYVCM
jgi:hypothetical protein